MRFWTIHGAPVLWPPTANSNRLLENLGYAGGTTEPFREIGRVTDSFKRQHIVPISSQERNMVRVSNDAAQALAAIELKASAARQEFRAHSPDAKWSDMAIGGVSLPLLNWLDWTPWAVVAIFALFVLFDSRVRKVIVPEVTAFWFPRLGSARDPLESFKPRGEQWVAVIFWLVFLTLPSLICYWAVITRFQIQPWIDFETLRWRNILDNPVDWFSPFAFAISLALTACTTASEDGQVSEQRARDAMWVVYFCVAAAVCATGIVLGLHMATPTTTLPLWDGRSYLALLLVVTALLAGLMRRCLSKLALVLLIAYTTISSLILVALY